jgi:hypothetical protein
VIDTEGRVEAGYDVAGLIAERHEDDVRREWHEPPHKDGIEGQAFWKKVAQKQLAQIAMTVPEQLRWMDLLAADIALVKASETPEELAQRLQDAGATLVGWLVDLASRAADRVKAEEGPDELEGLAEIGFGFSNDHIHKLEGAAA